MQTINKANGNIQLSTVSDFIHYLKDLVLSVGLPVTLKEYNIPFKDLNKLVEEASQQKRLLSKCPLELTKEDIKDIYVSAYEGVINSETVSVNN